MYGFSSFKVNPIILNFHEIDKPKAMSPFKVTNP